jgi:hypothetical protein
LINKALYLQGLEKITPALFEVMSLALSHRGQLVGRILKKKAIAAQKKN